MADLALSCLVSRTLISGSPAALQLEAPGTYRVVSAGPGATTWRRETVQSPFIHGEALIGAVKEQGSMNLKVRVYGTTDSNLASRVATLLAAFEQIEYTITFTVNSVAWGTWVCQPADYAPGASNDGLDPWGLRAKQQEYSFVIPRNPLQSAGPS